ncbi:MAG TPA: alpha/beta fold hydrolase [Solirubrobacteraceae bacterium]|jgi:pimeloyl-ACP methyl ester carboxylesterase
MPRRTPTFLLAAALALCCSAFFGVASAGALSFVPCAGTAAAGFACTTVPVPVSRTGLAAGTLSLSLERKQAGPAQSKTAVIALAGGPGQAALPLGEFIAKALAPALATRDLLVFDQRGTGTSDPLGCGALSSFGGGSASQAFERCALEIGPARGGYTTLESVEDIEAIRQAAGYEKLVLYGTSYGTKVAEEYAERYPQYVESMVLDSVVPPNGPEPFSIPTYQAISSVLGELCSNNACAGIATNPVADIASLTAQLRKRPLSGSVYDGSGHRHNVTLDESGLLGILEAGDLNPALRALLPAAVRSALNNYPNPLLRLEALAEGLIPNLPAGHPVEESAEIDEALYVATSCEEMPFPWQRSAPAATKLTEATGALKALPSTDFYPFDAATALSNSLISACDGWPNASATSTPAGVLPNVPTLILSGAQDLRTPTSNALQVAAKIPNAQLLVVPYTGHSVIGSDFGDCASLAVTAFFAGGVGGGQIQPCAPGVNPFAPTPLTPTRLAYVHPVPGLSGRPSLTLTAVLDTIVDLNRQVIGATLQADAQLPSGSSFGGLRGGYAKLSTSKLQLTRFTFIPGVELSGTFPVSRGQLQTTTLRITGSSAARGTVRVGSGKQVTGTLGGKRFNVNVAKVKLSRAGAGASEAEWSLMPFAFPLPKLSQLR